MSNASLPPTETDIAPDPETGSRGERIAKVLARAGVGSRREVERMIGDGRITLAGKTLTSPAVLVNDTTEIEVDGKPVAAPERAHIWRYHKPNNLICTRHDPEGRKTVFDALPRYLGRVISVGRLDLTSEGLLLLTNSGEVARYLEHPEQAIARVYRVRVHGRVSNAMIATLAEGVTADGITYAPVEAILERSTGSNHWLKLTLKEGKNREIRKLMEHLGLKVTRLIRTQYGPFALGNLAEGDVRTVPLAKIAEDMPALWRFFEGGDTTDDDTGERVPKREGWAKAKPKAKRPAKRRRPPAEKTIKAGQPERSKRSGSRSGSEGSRGAGGPSERKKR
ncbi:MAG: pseudouridine synthase [Pseudomonadota bacterium]